MAVIKQISVFDGSSWGTDDIGANAANIDFANSVGTTASIAGSSNLYTGLSNILPASKLTASRALVTGSDQRLATSNVTATQLGYLSGVTSSIQTQINTLNINLGNKANTSDAIKNITRSGTTFTATRANNTTFTFTQQDNNTTYSAATTATQGLMSAADKIKVNNLIQFGATSTTILTFGTYATKGSTHKLTQAYTNFKWLQIRVGSSTDSDGGGGRYDYLINVKDIDSSAQFCLFWWLNAALNAITITFPSTTSVKILYADAVKFNLSSKTIADASSSSVASGGLRAIYGYK